MKNTEKAISKVSLDWEEDHGERRNFIQFLAISDQFTLDIPHTHLTKYAEKISQLSNLVAEVKHWPDGETNADESRRDIGYRPENQENDHNQWTWKCMVNWENNDIEGCGLLTGKTVAIKDSISVAGIPMTGGSRSLEVSFVLSLSISKFLIEKKNNISMNNLLNMILGSENNSKPQGFHHCITLQNHLTKFLATRPCFLRTHLAPFYNKVNNKKLFAI